ncbi:MAG: hypothetical protein LBT55_05235 [Clostridiaceae bacterium]|jgi:hypothetical protein|nr:hypothetical protein [Clostridiaceae bacterium]
MLKPKNENNSNDSLDDEFLKKCGRIFAHDLLRYTENGGDMKDITANKVYKFLEELDKKQLP